MGNFNYEKYWLEKNGHDPITGRKIGEKLTVFPPKRSNNYQYRQSDTSISLDEEIR